MAQSATSDSDKAVLVHMAEAWRQLAERLEGPAPRRIDQNE